MTTYGDDDIFGNLKAVEQADFANAIRGSRNEPWNEQAGDERVAADNRPTYPCESCGGTGKYRGARIHQPKSECFACKGRGFFYQTREKRQANRFAAKAKKTNVLAEKQAEFDKANEGLMDFLRASDWSPFAKAMVEAYGKYGYLTEGQVRAANSMRAKQVERTNQREAEKAERLANAPVVDLSPIQAMFDKAISSGLRRTIYRAEGLVLSPAKSHSINVGAIYVKEHGTNEYLGKVVSGRFQAMRYATDEHKAALQTIAANPGEAAIKWGLTFKCCAVCGIELTDPVSRARGIGPICAEKWGF
jgi:hypothetical protein